MKLDLRSLLHFAVVAESGSFTLAAKRLDIAQPWLSQRIRALEARLGFPLFIRAGRTIELTSEGAKLYALAGRLPSLAREIGDLADELSVASRRSLRIGAPPYANRIAVVNDLLGELGTMYRDASIALEVGWSSHLVERVRQRELDATFALAPFDTSGLNTIEVGSLYRLFVLGPDSPGGDKTTIAPEALKGQSVAVFPRDVNPALFDLSFAPLIEAGVDLVPVAFDGRPMRGQVDASKLVTSYFGIADPIMHPEEKRIEGAAPIPLRFVTHADTASPLIRAAQGILTRSRPSSDAAPPSDNQDAASLPA